MRPLLTLLLLPALAHAAAPPEIVLRYVRPTKDGFTLESLVSERAAGDGVLYRSATHRGALTLTLTVRLDARRRVLSAEVVQTAGGKTMNATASFAGGEAVLTRGEKTEKLKAPADAVVTSAPDWSDIFWVVRRYDRAARGRQAFAGIWMHPAQPGRRLDFTVEPEADVSLDHGGKKLALTRYRVVLRSGAYLVWADAAGRVVCLMPPGRPGGAVILAGFEKAVAAFK